MTRPSPIPLFDLRFTAEQRRAVDKVLQEGWLSQGPRVEKMETEFASLFGKGHCVALSSGTAALHLALVLAGVVPGDDVIVPSLTFAATGNVVCLLGARPVFADIQALERPFLGPETVEPLLTSATKAVILVHYAGAPGPTAALRCLLRDRGIPLLEDTAHGPGQDANGRWLGTSAEFGCFSFFSNKVLSCGEGGLLWCKRKTDALRARCLRSHGIQANKGQAFRGPSIAYKIPEPGWNYRLDELHAALLITQLPFLTNTLERRQALVERYIRTLPDQTGLTIPLRKLLHGGFHLFPLLADSMNTRDRLRQALQAKGIQSGIHYQALHQISTYGHDSTRSLPITEDFCKRELSLPLYPHLRGQDVDRVCKVIHQTLSPKGS